MKSLSQMNARERGFRGEGVPPTAHYAAIWSWTTLPFSYTT